MLNPDNQISDQQRKKTYTKVGMLIVGAGLVLLMLSINFMKQHFPFLEIVWPVLLIVGLIMVATTAGNTLISLGSVILALLGSLSLLNGNNHTLRLFIGVIILSVGIFFLLRFALRRGVR